MKKRKLLIALLCGALVCLPLAGCNNKNGASGTDSSVQSEVSEESRTAQTAVRNIQAMCLPWILI